MPRSPWLCEVLGRERERASVRRLIAHEHAAGFKLHVQPLVEVQRDRIGPFHAGQLRAQIGRQGGQRADCAVDVEPQPFGRGQIGQVRPADRPRRC